MPICFRLLTHCDRLAASRAACTAGSRSAMSTAMIAMTTSSSLSLKARRLMVRSSLSMGGRVACGIDGSQDCPLWHHETVGVVAQLAPGELVERAAGEQGDPHGRESHPHADRGAPFRQVARDEEL